MTKNKTDNGLKMTTPKTSRKENRYVIINKENEVSELLFFLENHELQYVPESEHYLIKKYLT